FQIAGQDRERMRRIQTSLTLLANTLLERLNGLGIDPKTANTITEFTRTCADRFRLQLDGGWSWECVKTERDLYRILHPEASLSHRVFKRLILFGALFLPPKIFYGAQRALSQSSLYGRVRARLLPIPPMEHVQRGGRTP